MRRMPPSSPSLRRLLVAFAAAVLTVALAACGGDDDAAKTSSASGAGASGSACPDGGLKFGVEPFEDAAKLTPAYTTVAASLSKQLHCPVRVQIVEEYSAEVLAMANDKLDIAQFGPLGFVFANERADAEAVASFADSTGKLTTYKAGIWVPKASPIKTIADLKGKSLALADQGSTSGDALPRKAIRDAGMKDSDVKLAYTGGHPQSMLALTHGKIDAAEVNTQQIATASKEGQWDGAKYRQIWGSAPIPNDPVTVRGNLDPALKRQIARALLHLPKADVGKVGSYLGVDPAGPLVAVSKTTYQPLFDLAKTLGLTEKDV